MGDYVGNWESASDEVLKESDRLADRLIVNFDLAPGDNIYLADRCYSVVSGRYLQVEKMGTYSDDFGTVPGLIVTGAIGTARQPFNLGGPTDRNDGSREIFIRDADRIWKTLKQRRAAERRHGDTPFSSALTMATDALAQNLIKELELGMDVAQVGKVTYDISSTEQQGGGTTYLRAYPSKLPRNKVLLSSGIGLGNSCSLDSEPQREQLLADYTELRASFQEKVARHHLNKVTAAFSEATRVLPGQ